MVQLEFHAVFHVVASIAKLCRQNSWDGEIVLNVITVTELPI